MLQCNNPMTKEPKLQAAVRIVPEWQDYDQEIKQLFSRFHQEKASGTLLTTNETHPPSQEGEYFLSHYFEVQLLSSPGMFWNGNRHDI